jgi:glutamate carboxypeptidase
MTLIEDVHSRRGDLLSSLEEIVRRESPSTDKAAVDGLVRHLRERCQALDARVDARPETDWGDMTVASWPGTNDQSGQILVMTHIDTVWPVGTIERLPWSVEDKVARGPGVFDMKASVAMMLEAMRIIREQGLPHRPIKWLLNTEEEMGSPASRPLIEELAKESEYVLCLEPPVPPNGALKTARKGVGMFTVKITGQAAHAGADPTKGVSAIQELANQIQYLHSLTDLELGTTVNVGVVSGGTRRNVIPAEAEAVVDLRVVTLDEAERAVEAALGRAFRPKRVVFVAVSGHRIIGTASLDGRTVRTVFVAPDVQGRSVGKQLMAEVERAARDASVTVLVVPSSVTAERFYNKLGFKSVGDSYHGDERTIVMERYLAPS